MMCGMLMAKRKAEKIRARRLKNRTKAEKTRDQIGDARCNDEFSTMGQMRKVFLKVFQRLGGVDEFFDWAQSDSKNQTLFYKMLARLIPQETKHTVQGGRPIQLLIQSNIPRPQLTSMGDDQNVIDVVPKVVETDKLPILPVEKLEARRAKTDIPLHEISAMVQEQEDERIDN